MSLRKKSVRDLMSDDNLGGEAREFLESLKTYEYSIWDYGFTEKIRMVNQDPEIKNLLKDNNIELGNLESFALSKLDTSNEAIKQFARLGYLRESTRLFSDDALSFEALSQLLQVAYFNKNNIDLPPNTERSDEQAERLFKNIASGGGMYPVEVYYLSLNTNGIPKGAYHYNLKSKSLDLLQEFGAEEIADICKAYMCETRSIIDFDNAGGIIVLTGMVHRGSFKYGNKSVIFNYIDSGAIMNNIYLLAGELNIGCCAMGGYLDDIVKRYLGLKTNTQIITGSIFIGNKKS